MKKFISLAVSLSLLSGGLACNPAANTSAAAAGENKIYVSLSGSDSAEGTIDSPLATVNAAKEKAKKLSGSVTVYFREGTYTIDNTVKFDKSDKSDVTYKAYNNERVTFTSGKPYTGFQECTVNGVRAFKKYVGKDKKFNILFNEKTTFKKTRYPESGYLYVKSVNNSDALKDESGEEIFTGYKGMVVNAKDFGEFRNMSDIAIKLLHFWKDETLLISSYDKSTGHVGFNKYSSMQIKQNDRFFLENVFEMLKNEGEWYLDKSEGMLYVIPEENALPESYTVWGSETETMIDIDGADGISFENILFRANGFNYSNEREYSQAAYDATTCISYKNAKNFKIKNCEFKDIASCALFLGEAVQNAEIDSCVFNNIGAQAVFIHGKNIDADDPAVTKNISVTNNCISEYGRVYYNAVGILVIHANSVDISHNEVHDGYYTAISVGWVWGYSYSVTYNNKITDNLIYNIGQGWLSDMGGIYTLGNQPGTVISGNVIHNVLADPEEGGYGGWGLYLDEGSSYITAEKNLIYACGSDSYHLHYGSYNTVRNNIFALSGESQAKILSNYDRVAPEDGSKKAADFYGNIFLTDKKTRAVSRIRDKKAFDERDNLYWDLTNGKDLYIDMNDNRKKAMGIRTAVRKGIITNPIIADPMFKNAAEFDFELSSDSPAVKAGFETWDYSNAGTLKGTVIGISDTGGMTPYNYKAAPVPLTPSRELFHCLMEFICSVYDFFTKVCQYK